MDRYKRSILKKNKIYRPYTLDGIGNFYFFAGHDQDQLRVFCQFFWRRLQLRRQRCHRFLRTHLVRSVLQILIKMVVKIAVHGHLRRLRCVVCEVGWWRQLFQCHQFLRDVQSPSISIFDPVSITIASNINKSGEGNTMLELSNIGSSYGNKNLRLRVIPIEAI